ncbi:MAG: efflux RND transporter periplasmic adaptor subunit, partial [Myxococcota bacterium]|nr:efflux RND transporter periplasmic adaptor subunit [Myxococcota bacterium]
MVPDMPGKVKRLPVQVGDEVTQGQLLAQLDIDVAVLQRDQARAAVRLAELALAQAETEFGRAERLHQSGSLTDQQLDQARTGLEMSRQQLAQATAAAGLAGEQISGGELRAPFAGVVTSVGCEEGEFFNTMGMSPTGGSPTLVGLVNLDTIRIDLQVSDRDVARIAEGMRVQIHVDAVGEQLPAEGLVGEVVSVGLAADPMTRTFPVRVEANNPGRTIRAGMHSRVLLVLENRGDVLAVSAEAVRTLEEQSYVMVAAGDRARRVDVTTGMHGDGGVEITTGLDGSEQVITKGNFGLPDDALIEVAK